MKTDLKAWVIQAAEPVTANGYTLKALTEHNASPGHLDMIPLDMSFEYRKEGQAPDASPAYRRNFTVYMKPETGDLFIGALEICEFWGPYYEDDMETDYELLKLTIQLLMKEAMRGRSPEETCVVSGEEEMCFWPRKTRMLFACKGLREAPLFRELLNVRDADDHEETDAFLKLLGMFRPVAVFDPAEFCF